jgi:hypothetical protein
MEQPMCKQALIGFKLILSMHTNLLQMQGWMDLWQVKQELRRDMAEWRLLTTAIEYCELRNVGNRLNVLIRIMILLITSALLSFVLLYQRSATPIGQSLVFNYP